MFEKNIAYYQYWFRNLTVAKKADNVAPHKPLLLLSVIELVEKGVIASPQIVLSDELIETFAHNALIYANKDGHFKPNIGMPFYHMSGETFWKLVPKEPGQTRSSYTISSLRTYYKYAEIDSELFALMKDATARQRLRQVLLETYFKNHTNMPALPSLTSVIVIFSCLYGLIA